MFINYNLSNFFCDVKGAPIKLLLIYSLKQHNIWLIIMFNILMVGGKGYGTLFIIFATIADVKKISFRVADSGNVG